MEQTKRQKTKTRRAGSEIKETVRSRTPSKQPNAAKASEEKDDNGGGGTQVTLENAKKRKINIFKSGDDAIRFSFWHVQCIGLFRSHTYGWIA